MVQQFTGTVEIRNTESNQTVIFLEGGDDEGGANIILGGSGQNGDLVLRDSQGRQRIFLVGGQADIRLEQPDGSISVFLDGERGAITLGGPGTQGGVLNLRNSAGSDRIRLDAGSGNIITTGDVLIRDSIPFPDYVFADDYPLPSVAELACHIETHHRLPDVPSAEEVAATGVSVGRFCTLLLKKIEELTLLAIQQERVLTDQADRLALLDADRMVAS